MPRSCSQQCSHGSDTRLPDLNAGWLEQWDELSVPRCRMVAQRGFGEPCSWVHIFPSVEARAGSIFFGAGKSRLQGSAL